MVVLQYFDLMNMVKYKVTVLGLAKDLTILASVIANRAKLDVAI